MDLTEEELEATRNLKKDNGKIIIKTDKLKEMLDNVKDGLSSFLNRPALIGIKLESEKDNLRMITCDGFKILTASSEVIEADTFSAIIPLFKIPKGADKETKIEVEEGYVSIDFGIVRYVYKTIKGDFIDWKCFFDRENTFVIRLNPKLIKQAFTGIKGYVDLYFSNDREGVIIEDTNNKQNRKYVLPVRRKE